MVEYYKMVKYLICIIIGIILYVLLNHMNRFSVGGAVFDLIDKETGNIIHTIESETDTLESILDVFMDATDVELIKGVHNVVEVTDQLSKTGDTDRLVNPSIFEFTIRPGGEITDIKYIRDFYGGNIEDVENFVNPEDSGSFTVYGNNRINAINNFHKWQKIYPDAVGGAAAGGAATPTPSHSAAGGGATGASGGGGGAATPTPSHSAAGGAADAECPVKYNPKDSRIQCDTAIGKINLDVDYLSLIEPIIASKNIEEGDLKDITVLIRFANNDRENMKKYLIEIFETINTFIAPANCKLGNLDDSKVDIVISKLNSDNEGIKVTMDESENKTRYNNFLKFCARYVIILRNNYLKERLQELTSEGTKIKKRDYGEDQLNELVFEGLPLGAINTDDEKLKSEIELLAHNIDMGRPGFTTREEIDAKILEIQLKYIPPFDFGAPITKVSLFDSVDPTIRMGLKPLDKSNGSEGAYCNIPSENIVSGTKGGDEHKCNSFLWCNETNKCLPIRRILNTRSEHTCIKEDNIDGHIYLRLKKDPGYQEFGDPRAIGPTHKCRYSIEYGSIINIYKFNPETNDYVLFVKFSLCDIYKMDPEEGGSKQLGIKYDEKFQIKLNQLDGIANLTHPNNKIHVYKLTKQGYIPVFSDSEPTQDELLEDHKAFDYLTNITIKVPEIKINRCSSININPTEAVEGEQSELSVMSIKFNKGGAAGAAGGATGGATGGAAGGATGGATGGAAGGATEYDGFEYHKGMSLLGKATYNKCSILVNNENKSLDIYYDYVTFTDEQGREVAQFNEMDIKDFSKDDIGFNKIQLYKKGSMYYIKISYADGKELKIRTKNRTIRNVAFGHILLMLTIDRLFTDEEFQSSLFYLYLKKLNSNGKEERIYTSIETFKENVISNLIQGNFEVGLNTMRDDF